MLGGLLLSADLIAVDRIVAAQFLDGGLHDDDVLNLIAVVKDVCLMDECVRVDDIYLFLREEVVGEDSGSVVLLA